jgi:DNA-directed RNA polymerase specialized sigma subunit
MTPKEYLQQYRDAVRRAAAAQDHLDELRSMATRITPNYSSEGGGTHHTGDKLGAAVARIMDAESRVSDELEMLEATEREVVKTINGVQDGTLSTLLYERYINGKTWEQIAVLMNYTYRRVTQLHGKALNAVKDFLEFPT